MKTRKQRLFINSMYTFAIAIFSAILVAYAYDISNGTEIQTSSTKKGTQEILVSIAGFLGVTGSIVVGILQQEQVCFMPLASTENHRI